MVTSGFSPHSWQLYLWGAEVLATENLFSYPFLLSLLSCAKRPFFISSFHLFYASASSSNSGLPSAHSHSSWLAPLLLETPDQTMVKLLLHFSLFLSLHYFFALSLLFSSICFIPVPPVCHLHLSPTDLPALSLSPTDLPSLHYFLWFKPIFDSVFLYFFTYFLAVLDSIAESQICLSNKDDKAGSKGRVIWFFSDLINSFRTDISYCILDLLVIWLTPYRELKIKWGRIIPTKTKKKKKSKRWWTENFLSEVRKQKQPNVIRC